MNSNFSTEYDVHMYGCVHLSHIMVIAIVIGVASSKIVDASVQLTISTTNIIKGFCIISLYLYYAAQVLMVVVALVVVAVVVVETYE